MQDYDLNDFSKSKCDLRAEVMLKKLFAFIWTVMIVSFVSAGQPVGTSASKGAGAQVPVTVRSDQEIHFQDIGINHGVTSENSRPPQQLIARAASPAVLTP